MRQAQGITSSSLRTPKAAAAAGIIFSILIGIIFWLFRMSIPADPMESGAWLATESGTVALALNLVPFAGVAFLWFVGVLRDRLGQMEDRFFATVFLGSAILFLAMLFTASAVVGAVILVFASKPAAMIDSAIFHVARALAYNLVNVYLIKMAAVFMFSMSMVGFHTGLAPRWICYLGFALALLLLVGSYYVGWSVLLFPAWALLISIYILFDNFVGLDSRPHRVDT